MSVLQEFFGYFAIGIFSSAIGAIVGGLPCFYIGRYMRLVRIEVESGKSNRKSNSSGKKHTVGDSRESDSTTNGPDSFS